MYGNSGNGGAIQAVSSQGSLKDVVFINCTHEKGAGAMQTNAATYTFDNVTFINCTSLQPFHAHTVYMIGSNTAPTRVTFNGQIRFDGCGAGQNTETSVAIRMNNTGNTEWVVDTDTSNGARWIFANTPTSSLVIAGSTVKFSAKSFSSTNPSFSPGSSAFALSVSASAESINANSINIFEDFLIQGIGALVSMNGSTEFTVGGNFNSTNSPKTSVQLAAHTNITASGDVLINDAYESAIQSYAHFTLTAQNLFISRAGFASNSPLSAISLSQSGATIVVNNEMSVLGHKSSTLQGGAVAISDEGVVIIRANSFKMEGNSADESGGAIWLSSGSNLTIVATEIITFKENRASKGGALAANSSAIISFQSPAVSFKSNAATIGGALHIYATQATALSGASFQNNIATEACVAYFVDSCPNFVPLGGSNGNLQSIPLSDPHNNCHLMSELCQAPDGSAPCPPSSLPQPPFFCDNGIWTSYSTVSTPLLVLPPGTTLVHGNLSVTTLSISGLNSFIVTDGCLRVNGSFVVVLSRRDLETIKELGDHYSSQISNRTCSQQSSIPVAIESPATSCEIVSASSMTMTTGAIEILFDIQQRSSCSHRTHTWWIVLVAVIGSATIVIVAIVLLSHYNQKFKAMVRPFTARNSK
jgi:predicted outer membrane repeat protein